MRPYCGNSILRAISALIFVCHFRLAAISRAISRAILLGGAPAALTHAQIRRRKVLLPPADRLVDYLEDFAALCAALPDGVSGD